MVLAINYLMHTDVNVDVSVLQQASFLHVLLTSLTVLTLPLVCHHKQVLACNLPLHDLVLAT